MTLRIVFMGTPDFAVVGLKALIAAGHDIVCVYTQPPRRAGRGQSDRPSPVDAFASDTGIEVRTPTTLKAAEEQAAFGALDADVAVVAAYGLILPKAMLAAPRHGCVNIHASLLPRWRGAAPIVRAILAGDKQTGVTIMRMDEGLDTGPMLMRESVTIAPAATAGDLHDALAALGARMIVEALAQLEAGTLTETAQLQDGVTYAAKIDKAETRLDWTRPAVDLERMVRAFAPGAWFAIDGERIRVLAAEIAGGGGKPGEVLDANLTIACGGGALRPTRLQRAGKAAMDAGAFLRGKAVAAGTVLP